MDIISTILWCFIYNGLYQALVYINISELSKQKTDMTTSTQTYDSYYNNMMRQYYTKETIPIKQKLQVFLKFVFPSYNVIH